jgi:nucleotide-binding universal stress UspA family protein
MSIAPCVLCPVDLSEASRGALRYAGALAEHFYARLLVLAVESPFLTDAAGAVMERHWLDHQIESALQTFVADTFKARTPEVAELRTQITRGRPAAEILRVANEANVDVIVMSTHGKTGVRKLMFGSVTEQVLRDAQVPVVVTPATDPGPESVEAWKKGVNTVLVPVDFSDWTPQQTNIARGLAEALGADLVCAHVLEDQDHGRRLAAHEKLDAIIHRMPAALKPAMTLGVGDAAAEISRISRERKAGLIVMGLHSSGRARQHMGHVTYAVLCQAPALVLAWPPKRLGASLSAA